MQWEYVPQYGRLADPGQDAPDNGGRPLRNRWPARRAIQLYAAHERASMTQMNFVGQRHARSASAAITKIPRNPDRIDLFGQGRIQTPHKITPPHASSIRPVMVGAAVGVRVEDRRQAGLGQGFGK